MQFPQHRLSVQPAARRVKDIAGCRRLSSQTPDHASRELAVPASLFLAAAMRVHGLGD
jgi:hypothetical protein